MHTQIKPRSAEKRIDKTALAIKAARMLKGLSRKAAQYLGVSRGFLRGRLAAWSWDSQQD